MNTFKITYENGDTTITGMNATLDEAKAYYIGTYFQFGDTEECPYDRMIKAVDVEQIEPFNDIGRDLNGTV